MTNLIDNSTKTAEEATSETDIPTQGISGEKMSEVPLEMTGKEDGIRCLLSVEEVNLKETKVFAVYYDAKDVAYLHGPENTLRRAERCLTSQTFAEEFEYDLRQNNCEHFATWRKTGILMSKQVKTAAAAMLWAGGILSTALAGRIIEILHAVWLASENIRSGQGSHFTAHVLKQTFDSLVINQLFGSAYHPQSQGAVEHLHQALKSMIKSYTFDHEKDWDIGLPFLLFCFQG